MAPPTRGGASSAAIAVLAVLVAAVALLLVARSVSPGDGNGAPSGSVGSSTPAGSVLGTVLAPATGFAPGSAAGSAATSSGASPGAVVLVGAGDIADCGSNGDEATARLLDSIAGTVFTLGDDAYERGTADQFRNCYDPTWGRALARTRPVAGNHEYETPGATGYFGYFGTAAGDPATGWYAYDAGAWRVYALNSNCGFIGGCDAGSAQERWLRQDLAEHPRVCVLAMWHHPRFSSGPHGDDAETAGLWQALYDAGAELILDGHDHDYERFAPQTPAGLADPERGITEIVAGTGGRGHYEFQTIRANSLVRDNRTFGVLELDLADGAWTSRFVPVAGSTFTDSDSGTCH